MKAAEIRAARKVEPWLEAYIEPGDETIESARGRFEVAQRVALRRMAADGVELHRRHVKAGGMLTTSLDHHGTVRR